MESLQRGARLKLDEHLNSSQDIIVDVGVSGPASYNYSCFGIDANNKLSDERYMIFYNQTNSPNNEIIQMQNQCSVSYKIQLAKLPATIQKLVFTASIDGNGTMSAINSCEVKIKQGVEKLSFVLTGKDFQNEKAIIAIEIYKKDVWRLNAIGSGFNGGFSDLMKSYGGKEIPQFTKLIPPEPPKVKFSKITLEKGKKISLEKQTGVSLGEIVVNLNWHRGDKNKSFLSNLLGKNNSIDLDLGCLYELKDGSKRAVQALGNAFGDYNCPPYIVLDGDDRTGNSQDGENLRINGSEISKIKRILIYTFIYEGVADWMSTDGTVTLKCPGSSDIIIHLDEYGSSQIMCAIALLENKSGDNFEIEKIVRFFDGHQQMDRAFNWGLDWVRGSK